MADVTHLRRHESVQTIFDEAVPLVRELRTQVRIVQADVPEGVVPGISSANPVPVRPDPVVTSYVTPDS